jgi:hypothetical protein
VTAGGAVRGIRIISGTKEGLDGHFGICTADLEFVVWKKVMDCGKSL